MALRSLRRKTDMTLRALLFAGLGAAHLLLSWIGAGSAAGAVVWPVLIHG